MRVIGYLGFMAFVLRSSALPMALFPNAVVNRLQTTSAFAHHHDHPKVPLGVFRSVSSNPPPSSSRPSESTISETSALTRPLSIKTSPTLSPPLVSALPLLTPALPTFPLLSESFVGDRGTQRVSPSLSSHFRSSLANKNNPAALSSPQLYSEISKTLNLSPNMMSKLKSIIKCQSGGTCEAIEPPSQFAQFKPKRSRATYIFNSFVPEYLESLEEADANELLIGGNIFQPPPAPSKEQLESRARDFVAKAEGATRAVEKAEEAAKFVRQQEYKHRAQNTASKFQNAAVAANLAVSAAQREREFEVKTQAQLDLLKGREAAQIEVEAEQPSVDPDSTAIFLAMAEKSSQSYRKMFSRATNKVKLGVSRQALPGQRLARVCEGVDGLVALASLAQDMQLQVKKCRGNQRLAFILSRLVHDHSLPSSLPLDRDLDLLQNANGKILSNDQANEIRNAVLATEKGGGDASGQAFLVQRSGDVAHSFLVEQRKAE